MGEPVHPDTLSSLFPILIKRYNPANPRTPSPHARLHDLRHIHATITLRAYAHMIRAAEASAADVLAEAIGEG
ncbi:hypothetical protein ACFFV7_12780 [Nonomuraea spiralis]|uniref:Integrase n=1 Tax=Nonomuraea spiralis TaxID=46182 RepID=A0ABV5IC11_9ACTN|nr:hypothetical protein [Nonomuraea spiralis]GGS79191.1 hypothetical protein GCM10010176_023050 [Nonomuraea spiralis]